MGLYLIIYDRSTGAAEVHAEFADDEAQQAMKARFDAEREVGETSNVEVVVLSADSVQSLHRSHARYFNSVLELASQELPPDAAGSSASGAL